MPNWKRTKNALKALFRLVRPFPLRNNSIPLSCNPFFIVSTGRAGTTLFRAILNQHPEICIPPETDYFWRVIVNYKRNYRYYSWLNIVTLFCGEMAIGQEFPNSDIKLKRFYHQAKKIRPNRQSLDHLFDAYFQYYIQEHKPGATRWGDKTPHNLAFLSQIDSIFPKARHIHLYRDGRDVAASFYKLGWANTPEEACNQWLLRMEGAFTYPGRQNSEKFLDIRYEDLVHHPDQIIQQACDFLQISYQPQMLDFHLKPTEFRGDKIRPDLHPMLSEPISAKSIGNWRQVFNPQQQESVQTKLKPTLIRLGYDLD